MQPLSPQPHNCPSLQNLARPSLSETASAATPALGGDTHTAVRRPVQQYTTPTSWWMQNKHCRPVNAGPCSNAHALQSMQPLEPVTSLQGTCLASTSQALPVWLAKCMRRTAMHIAPPPPKDTCKVRTQTGQCDQARTARRRSKRGTPRQAAIARNGVGLSSEKEATSQEGGLQ